MSPENNNPPEKPISPSRLLRGQRILEHPERYQACHGCESVVSAVIRIVDEKTGNVTYIDRPGVCPNCASYHFERKRRDVIQQTEFILFGKGRSIFGDDGVRSPEGPSDFLAS